MVEEQKASGGKSCALSSAENGIENPGLELMVILQFSFHTVTGCHVTSCRVFGCCQSPQPLAGL